MKDLKISFAAVIIDFSWLRLLRLFRPRAGLG
jgi:hypothetical protein